MDRIRQDDDNKFRPEQQLDEEIQQELEAAFGDMSVFDMLDAEEQAQRKTGVQNIRKGIIVAIHNDDVFVDIGGKSQGILPAKQFGDDLPNPGEEVEVVVEHYKPDEGIVLLSLPGAVKEADWDTLEVGQIVEGVVTGHNKGGLELKINGIRAFMPISQIEMFQVDDLHPYMNQKLKCQVVELDKANRNLVVSRRFVLERELAEARQKLIDELYEGKTVEGIVKTIMPYGAFVDIGGLDGLLHIRDMSHRRIDDPNEVVHPGQHLELIVLKFDREEQKLSLGLKQIMPDPWKDAETKYQPGSVITGRISHLEDFGAFVELEEGLEGLIPIGEITYERRIRHPSEILKEGEIVKVKIMQVDISRKRISLSIKQVGDDPWLGASVRWPADTVVRGTVTRITDFGAFVQLSPGVEGLVHISELSDKKVRSAADVVNVGEEVDVKVLSVDEENRRIALSIKQAAGLGDNSQAVGGMSSEQIEAEKSQKKKKRKTPLKGGLD